MVKDRHYLVNASFSPDPRPFERPNFPRLLQVFIIASMPDLSFSILRLELGDLLRIKQLVDRLSHNLALEDLTLNLERGCFLKLHPGMRKDLITNQPHSWIEL